MGFRFEADERRLEFYLELENIHKIMDLNKGRVRFPALESLHLQCYHPDYKFDKGPPRGDFVMFPDLNFWSNWDLPKLRRFYISDTSRDVRADFRTLQGEDLTSLSADYHCDCYSDGDLHGYMHFVGGFQHLRELELTFYKMKREGHNNFGQLRLPNLESLQVHFTPNAFRFRGQAWIVFTDMMRYLVTPRLSQLALQADTTRTRNIMAWLKCIDHNRLMTLRRIYVQFCEPAFGVLFQLPHLVGGFLSDPNSVFLDDIEDKTMPDLPKLELAGLPDDPTHDFAEHLFEDENARGYLGQFTWFREDRLMGDSSETDYMYSSEEEVMGHNF